MRHPLIATLALAASLACAAAPARADGSTDMNALSVVVIGSVVVTGSAVSAAAGAVPSELPAAAALVVVGVHASYRGTVIVLERVSDGARASVELTGRVSVAVGTVVATTAVASGTVLSVAGEVIAFVPNAIGRALLHNEVAAR